MRYVIRTWILVVSVVLSSWATAHQLENIFLEMERDGDHAWKGLIYFDAGYSLPEMRADRLAPQPRAEWLANCDETEWKRLREGAEAYLRECLVFALDDGSRPLDWKVTFPDFDKSPPDFPQLLDDGAYFRVNLSGEMPVGVMSLWVNNGQRPNFTVSRPGSDEILIILPGNEAQLIHKTRNNVPIGVPRESWLSRAYAFSRLGFYHVIPDGLDHVLFILALFFLTARWRPLLVQSLMFTLAHSVTLALAVTGVVTVSAAVVEPLVALSITCVAFENLWARKMGRRRLCLVFSFGLIHGLGFAGALSGSLHASRQREWMMPLVSVNIGVEVAQLSILLVLFLLFVWFVEKPWYERFRRGASVAIGLAGLWWFLERIISLQR